MNATGGSLRRWISIGGSANMEVGNPGAFRFSRAAASESNSWVGACCDFYEIYGSTGIGFLTVGGRVGYGINYAAGTYQFCISIMGLAWYGGAWNNL